MYIYSDGIPRLGAGPAARSGNGGANMHRCRARDIIDIFDIINRRRATDTRNCGSLDASRGEWVFRRRRSR